MITMTLEQLSQAMGARLLQGSSQSTISGVATDTRNIKKGDLFIALIGARYDAHDFLAQAVAGGAGAVVVDRRVQLPAEVPVLRVSDTLAALQALAAHVRSGFNLPVLGVTGSSGKTTTKDITAGVLGTRWQVLKTQGNFNNEIGLPLTLLNLTPSHGAAVLEMGMRGPGEIDALGRIARPTAAIINHIGVAHVGRLGSKENIAQAKGELLEHIPAHGFALLPGDNALARAQASRCRGQVLFFGRDPGLDIRVQDIRWQNQRSYFTVVTDQVTQEFNLPLAGTHNVINALPAVGAALLLGLTPDQIARGLSQVNLSGMRMEIISAGGYTIINDAYNANPDSTAAALQTMGQIAGDSRQIAALGDMLELGPIAPDSHTRMGAIVAQSGVELLITVGTWANHMAQGARAAGMPAQSVITCQDNTQAAEALLESLKTGDTVLVKGSRSMQMEQIVKQITGDFTSGQS